MCHIQRNKKREERQKGGKRKRNVQGSLHVIVTDWKQKITNQSAGLWSLQRKDWLMNSPPRFWSVSHLTCNFGDSSFLSCLFMRLGSHSCHQRKGTITVVPGNALSHGVVMRDWKVLCLKTFWGACVWGKRQIRCWGDAMSCTPHPLDPIMAANHWRSGGKQFTLQPWSSG